MRWSIEVTFTEVRRYLGVETPRQRAAKAIARTTPALLALFSSICLMVHRLLDHWASLPRSTAWYLKPQATFSDCLARVRRTIWAEGNDVNLLADQGLDHNSAHLVQSRRRRSLAEHGLARANPYGPAGLGRICDQGPDQDQVIISRSAWERALAQLAATA